MQERRVEGDQTGGHERTAQRQGERRIDLNVDGEGRAWAGSERGRREGERRVTMRRKTRCGLILTALSAAASTQTMAPVARCNHQNSDGAML